MGFNIVGEEGGATFVSQRLYGVSSYPTELVPTRQKSSFLVGFQLFAEGLCLIDGPMENYWHR